MLFLSFSARPIHAPGGGAVGVAGLTSGSLSPCLASSLALAQLCGPALGLGRPANRSERRRSSSKGTLPSAGGGSPSTPLLMDDVLRVCMGRRSMPDGTGGTGGIRGEDFAARSAGRRYGLWGGVGGEEEEFGADMVSAAPPPTSSGVKGCVAGEYGDDTTREPEELSSWFEGDLEECGWLGAGP
jgi:hypothetical protein